MKTALYLSGGGARGAYQAGVLKGIHEITGSQTLPVDSISCVSAGAINASLLAMHVDDFGYASNQLAHLWSNLSCSTIFEVDEVSLVKSVLRNVAGMIFHYRAAGGSYLLDTEPLRNLLNNNLDFRKINENIETGILQDFEIAAMCYDLHETVSFVNSKNKQTHWSSLRHVSRLQPLCADHVVASSAFPLFFPAVQLHQKHYGDGGLRLSSPLRGAVKMGADKILIIGTRMVPDDVSDADTNTNIGDISFASVIGNMFNALFLDNLDRDIGLIERVNSTLTLLTDEMKEQIGCRKIETLYIRPSVDLGELATSYQSALPRMLRYLMTAYGGKSQSGDFLSFLLFEGAYCKKLVEVGYSDAIMQKESIKAFLQ